MDKNIHEAIKHYYGQLNSYTGNARDVKKADKHMDGFTSIFKKAIRPEYFVSEKHQATVKGAMLNKRWDVAYGTNSEFKSALELKSIVMSKMGKCFSNRVEEAIGVATDLRHVNSDIRLNYFLVIEDDYPATHKLREEKFEKIKEFCSLIEHDLCLYDNVGCVVIDSEFNCSNLYSNVQEFTNRWRGTNE